MKRTNDLSTAGGQPLSSAPRQSIPILFVTGPYRTEGFPRIRDIRFGSGMSLSVKSRTFSPVLRKRLSCSMSPLHSPLRIREAEARVRLQAGPGTMKTFATINRGSSSGHPSGDSTWPVTRPSQPSSWAVFPQRSKPAGGQPEQ